MGKDREKITGEIYTIVADKTRNEMDEILSNIAVYNSGPHCGIGIESIRIELLKALR